ncbi:GSCOCG00001833001-RA-CDS [Cotesia congregata]|nr:GSCOCG00001833001-RA-CDS [Cotesia congregata]
MFKVNFLEYKQTLTKFLKKKHLRYGIPFILFCIGGSFGLSRVTDVRYKYRKVSSVRDEAKHEGLNLRKPEELTLESQYEKLKNQLDIDHWENKRIERPWEEGVEKNAEKS